MIRMSSRPEGVRFRTEKVIWFKTFASKFRFGIVANQTANIKGMPHHVG
jgi:hypothetical protein